MERRTSDASLADLKALRPPGILILLIGFAANPWIVSRLKPHGKMDLVLALFVLAFDLCLIVVGSVFVFAKKKRTTFRAVLTVVSLIAWSTVLLGVGEIYLTTRPVTRGPYDSFHIQHLHPFYFFSLPSDSAELAKANNGVVSVTPEGFRGPGPESKGTRKLAFILGGSSAFGDGASSDQTTISAYLNGLQEEYFFVNAGVPSWNSTQEFYRVSMQLLRYEPDLIVVYDGANDVEINRGYLEDGLTYPPGTPESFNDLSRRMDDIRAEPEPPLLAFNLSALYAVTFPRIRMRIGQKLHWAQPDREIEEPKKRVPAEAADGGAEAYLWNIDNIRRLTAARGTKLVVFWQAISHLHRSGNATDILLGEQTQDHGFLRRFHQYVVEHRDSDLQFYDLADVFDKYSGTLQMSDVFLDSVHLTDQGNRLVATEIWSRVSQFGRR